MAAILAMALRLWDINLMKSAIRTLALVAVAFFLLPASPALASGSIECQGHTIPDTSTTGKTVCTKNFYFSGTCTGAESNPYLNDGGEINAPLAPPWEPVSISILDVWIVLWPPAPAVFYAFAGNSWNSDIMGWITNGGIDRHLPAGTQMQFPAIGTDASSLAAPHLDLHFWCPAGGGAYQGYYNVVYVPNPI